MVEAAQSNVTRHLLAVVAAVVVAAAAVVGVIRWVNSDDSATPPPYRDAAVTGVIGLCDRSGHAVTSGSTTAAPFVWRAVGSSAAPAAYAIGGRTATLYAFQPRAGTAPSEWSGQQLTASGRYTNPKHPMAQATVNDIDLKDFLTVYPATDSAFVQLRLYLGAPNQPLSATAYAATDIKVSGSSWRVARGGSVSCTDGTAESFESVVSATAKRTPSR